MKKYRIGITFGAFDPLHYGHVRLFKRCKEHCDKLIVAVSDAGYIQKHKGREEYVPFFDRVKAIEEIKCVDDITRQSTSVGKKELVKLMSAEVIFVGDDWNPGTFTGEGLGVPVIYLPYTKQVTSTELREAGI